MKNAAKAKGVKTGTAIAQSVFRNARNTAKARGAARVVIYADTSGPKAEIREKHLRYMGIAVPKLIDPTQPSTPSNIKWVLTSKGVTLPASTYFNAKASGLTAANKDTIRFPGSTTKKGCYYYEFNSEGGLRTPQSTPVSRFVIQAGTLAPGQETPKKSKKRSKDASGFYIRKSGRMSLFRSPNQIIEITGNLDF